MDTNEQLVCANKFLELYYAKELVDPSLSDKSYLSIDFNNLTKYNYELAEDLLLDAENVLQVFRHSIKEITGKTVDVRLVNCFSQSKKDINELRIEHAGKLLSVEGMVRQKSDVRADIVTATFECPACGNVINVLQTDASSFKVPGVCACGRKANFRLINKTCRDVYTISLEESTELVDGGTKLAKIPILCTGSLANSDIERLIYQGVRARVTGILKDFQKKNNRGTLTSRIEWYLEANNIELLDDSLQKVKWDSEDIKSFKQLAKENNPLSTLREKVFGNHMESWFEECEGALISLFGGISKNLDNGIHQRGEIHALFIGEAGMAKSTILKISQKISPKASYAAGTGISKGGLTAIAVNDDLIGGWTSDAGMLVLCNGGHAMIDELDKVSDEDRKGLHEALSEGTVSLNKAAKGTFMARTSVLAAANPKFGNFSDYDTIYSQINLTPTLINRFDLIYPIKASKLSSEEQGGIARKILGRGKIDTTNEQGFARKYIAYARTINPVMSEEVREFFTEKYVELTDKKKSLTGNDKRPSIPISGRQVEAFKRVAEAIARSKLHEKISLEDAEQAYEKVIYCLQQLGVDPESGELIASETNMGGPTYKESDLRARINRLTKDLRGDDGLTDYEEVVTVIESEGVSREKIEETIKKLNTAGDLFFPKIGKMKTI